MFFIGIEFGKDSRCFDLFNNAIRPWELFESPVYFRIKDGATHTKIQRINLGIKFQENSVL